MPLLNTITIEEATDRLIDYRGKTPPKTDSGVRLITAKVVKGGQILGEPAEFIAADFYDEWMRRGLPQKMDVLLTTEAPLGEVAVLRDGEKIALAQRIILLRAKPGKVDPLFLFYALQSGFGQDELRARASGTTVLGIKQSELRKVRIPIFSLSIQRRVAGILSAYDELIENSQRRIELLESMARALYREWFVHFRFPGHERAPRVASPLGEIPRGWAVKEMREVADVIDCLHSKKPKECSSGPGIFLQLVNIGVGGKLDMRGQFRISADDYARWTSRIELQAGDCVITNVGRVGAVGQIPEGVKAAPGRNMTAVRPRAGLLTPTYLIEYLLSPHMTSEVAKKKDLGTIMDSLNVKGIVRLHIPCPPMDAMHRFESIARPLRRRIEVLVDQIQNLRRTRDLLLPRLLSGQIDIGRLS